MAGGGRKVNPFLFFERQREALPSVSEVCTAPVLAIARRGFSLALEEE
jgi:hypothetical protein